MHLWTFGLAGDRVTKIQGPEGQVHIVAPHIAEGSLAEVPPATPLGGMVASHGVRSLGRRAEPQIPIQVRRYRIGLVGTIPAPPTFANPNVDFFHITDPAGLNDFHHPAVI